MRSLLTGPTTTHACFCTARIRRLFVLVVLISLCFYPTGVSLLAAAAVTTTTTETAQQQAEADEALFEAVRQDDEALILEALKTGANANINAIGPGGQTPLMHAVLMGKDTAARVAGTWRCRHEYWRKGWLYAHARYECVCVLLCVLLLLLPCPCHGCTNLL